jgi:hypothetical protein
VSSTGEFCVDPDDVEGEAPLSLFETCLKRLSEELEKTVED